MAITPRSAADAKDLQAAALALGRALNAPPATQQDIWTKLTIYKVPYYFCNPEGIQEVLLPQLNKEVKRAFGKAPVQVSWGNSDTRNPTTPTLLLAF